MLGKKFRDRQKPMVLVLGLGESGFAISRWCAQYGCRLRVVDTREVPPKLSALEAHCSGARFISGAFSSALLEDVELVGISPGLSPLSPDLLPLITVAHERGIPIWGELEFFAQALKTLSKRGYAPKIIAITGTNGKTTTTRLVGMLCERAGKKVVVAGNICLAVLNKLAEAINSVALPEIWVLELSSFQLNTARTFSPDAAAVLNITQDHLDWHGRFDAYVTAKSHVFGPNTVRILNRDDARVMALARTTIAHSFVPTVTFGLNEPQRCGDYGLLRENDMLWLVEAHDHTVSDELSSAFYRKYDDESISPTNISLKRLMPASALRIRGLHNAANALAAFAITRAINLPITPLLYGLSEYRGEPHRIELIASIGGIDYVDDSKSTNVGATVAALDSLEQRAVLIAGGDGKGQDFSPLAVAVMRWCRAVMLIGRDTLQMRMMLERTGIIFAEHLTLETATHAAIMLARPGDVVLLSPACASFDMFKNYVHRAAVFRNTVKHCMLERG